MINYRLFFSIFFLVIGSSVIGISCTGNDVIDKSGSTSDTTISDLESIDETTPSITTTDSIVKASDSLQQILAEVEEELSSWDLKEIRRSKALADFGETPLGSYLMDLIPQRDCNSTEVVTYDYCKEHGYGSSRYRHLPDYFGPILEKYDRRIYVYGVDSVNVVAGKSPATIIGDSIFVTSYTAMNCFGGNGYENYLSNYLFLTYESGEFATSERIEFAFKNQLAEYLQQHDCYTFIDSKECKFMNGLVFDRISEGKVYGHYSVGSFHGWWIRAIGEFVFDLETLKLTIASNKIVNSQG